MVDGRENMDGVGCVLTSRVVLLVVEVLTKTFTDRTTYVCGVVWKREK